MLLLFIVINSYDFLDQLLELGKAKLVLFFVHDNAYRRPKCI